MKTKTTLLFLLFAMNFSYKAQTYVTIQDANFVVWLQIHYPSCMSGNQMDITCAGIQNETYLSINDSSAINDLAGIEHFINVQTLNIFSIPLTTFPTLPNSLLYLSCTNTPLTSLATLPNSLINLQCSYNQLTTLPTLPNSLTYLDCYANDLTSLPTLPNSLTNLNCSNNLLPSLPILPNLLTYLICWGNQLSSLPSIPGSLTYIDCSGNQLSSLPALPNSLTHLSCMNNQLATLPTLPNSLTGLSCMGNLLTNLPTLPNSLINLECGSNQLTSLPSLPGTLIQLFCYYNQLTSLPILPNSLHALDCTNNQISCFPVFPVSLDTLFIITGNPFTCLPNYIPSMDVGLLSFPLCINGDLINNPNGCNGTKGVFGTTYKDNNSNCTMDGGDQGYAHIPIKLYDSSNNLLAQTYSFSNGMYYFPDSVGVYKVKLDTLGMSFTSACIYPGIDSSFTLNSSNDYSTRINFDIACKPGFDIGVQAVTPRGIVFPGEQNKLSIIAGDMTHWYNFNCASGMSGQVQVTVTGPVTYNGIAFSALTPLVSGSVYTYNIADFGNVNMQQDFELLFTTDTSAQTGDQICVNVVVTPSVGDNNTANNNYQFCYSVGNSYDPNLKEVYPVDVEPGFQDYFTYTIHFQNTGTAPAMNIRLVDTLNNNLELETFQVINYSHNNTVALNNNILTFRFPNIQLPDSTSNTEGSKGFVQYRIKPKANLSLGTQITNTANIYFDYNSPITTNTTINTFVTAVNLQNFSGTINTVLIAPNPFTSQTTIAFTQEQKSTTIKIMDVLGKEIKRINFTGKQMVLEKGEMKSGIYFIQVIDANKNVVNKKIVIQ